MHHLGSQGMSHVCSVLFQCHCKSGSLQRYSGCTHITWHLGTRNSCFATGNCLPSMQMTKPWQSESRSVNWEGSRLQTSDLILKLLFLGWEGNWIVATVTSKEFPTMGCRDWCKVNLLSRITAGFWAAASSILTEREDRIHGFVPD